MSMLHYSASSETGERVIFIYGRANQDFGHVYARVARIANPECDGERVARIANPECDGERDCSGIRHCSWSKDSGRKYFIEDLVIYNQITLRENSAPYGLTVAYRESFEIGFAEVREAVKTFSLLEKHGIEASRYHDGKIIEEYIVKLAQALKIKRIAVANDALNYSYVNINKFVDLSEVAGVVSQVEKQVRDAR